MRRPPVRKVRNLLSVDWDFFLPVDHGSQLFDWGHAENGLFMGPLMWQLRAAPFIQAGLPLPTCQGWQTFWQRFRFAKNTTLFYGDSHSLAAHSLVHMGITGRCENWDGHHDLGYRPDSLERIHRTMTVDCSDWMLLYHEILGLQTRVVLPPWMRSIESELERGREVGAEVVQDDGTDQAEPFHRIYVARSGAWTPTWCDLDFQAFIDACPVGKKVDLSAMEGHPVLPREFDMAQAEATAQQWTEAMAAHRQRAS